MAERKVSLEISAKVGEALKAFRDMEESVSKFGRSNESMLADLEKTDETFAELSKATKGLADSVNELRQLKTLAESFAELQQKAADTAVKLRDAEDAVAGSSTAYARAAQAAKEAAAEYNQLKAALTNLGSEQDRISARQKQLTDTLDIARKVQETEAKIEDYNDSLRMLSSEADRAARRQARLREELEYNKSIGRDGMSKDQASVLNAQAKVIEKALSNIGKYLTKNAEQQAQVRSSIESTTEAFTRLGESASRRGVDVRELLVPVQTLEAELGALGTRAQETAAKMLPIQGSLSLAETAAKETAKGLTSAGNELAKAETKFKSVSSASDKLAASLAPIGAKLREAGVSTSNMAATQDKLTAELKQTETALRESDAAMRGYVKSVNSASEAKRKFLENGRTALSFVQRIRSEVLSAVSAFVGLYAAVDQVQKAFQTAAKVQGARNALLPVNNNEVELVAEELAYVRDLADRTGQSFTVLAAQYAKIRASAAASGMTLNAQRVIFEGIVTAAAGMQIGNENLERSLYAVGQILNKTKISSEELNGQLGDALPGAMALLTEATGKTSAELLKMMEDGKLTSEVLISMAATANNKFGPALAKALQEPELQANLLYNVIDDLRVLFRDTAKEAGLAKAISDITKALSSEEAEKGVQALARGFVALVEIVPELIQAFQVLMPLMGGFATVTAIRVAASLTGLTGGVGGLTIAVKGLWAAMFGWIGVIAFAVGSLVTLYQTNEDVRGVVVTAFVGMKDAVDEFVTSIRTGFKKIEIYVAAAENGITRMWNTVVKAAAAVYKAIGAETLANALTSTFTVAEKDIEKRAARLRKDIEDIEAERKKRAEANDKELWDVATKKPKEEIDPTKIDMAAALAEEEALAKKNAEIAAEKKAKEEKEKLNKQHADDVLRIDKEMYGARADLAQDENAKLELRLQEIAAAYQDEIKKFTEAGDMEAVKKVQDLIKVKQDVERQNTAALLAKRENKELQKELKDADKLRREITNQYEGLVDDILRVERDISLAEAKLAGTPAAAIADNMDAIRQSYQNLLNQLREVEQSSYSTPEQKAGAEQAIQRVEKLIELKQKELAVTTMIDEAEAREDEINAILEERDRKIDIINVKRQNGLFTELQAEKEILAIENDSVEVIHKKADLAIEYAQAVVDAKDATDEQVRKAQELIDKMRQLKRLTQEQEFQLFKAAEINQQLADGFSDGLLEAGKALGDVVQGTKDWGDAWVSVRDTMREFFAELLMNWAKALANNAMLELISGDGKKSQGLGGFFSDALNDISGSKTTPTNKPSAEGETPEKATESVFGGMFEGLGETFTGAWDSFSGLFSTKTDQNTQATEQGSQSIIGSLTGALLNGFNTLVAAIFSSSAAEGGASAAGSAAGAMVAHRGAVVGRPHGSNRSVPSSVFANARYYHSGGVVGLKRDEYPAILKRNEEVLTDKDPRNVLNGGATQAPANVKIVNAIDSASVIQHALSNANGQKAVINFMRANKSAIKSVLS